MIAKLRWSTVLLSLCVLGACDGGGRATDAAQAEDERDARANEESRDVYLPDDPDTGDPSDFMPANAPDAEPAYNPNEPPEDAEVRPDAMVPPRGDCTTLSVGDEESLESKLIQSRTWLRIEPDVCPATRLTDREVAFEIHWICAGADSIELEVTMFGADQVAAPDAIGDPVLVAYRDGSRLMSDPFSCLAVSDDAEGFGSSARIEGLVVGSGERVAIVATSYERPDQHGVGSYRLELRAR